MGPLPGALREACESHVPALAKRGTPQDREINVLAHHASVLAQKHVQALDQEGVGFWGPVGQDLSLSSGDTAAALSYCAQVGSAIGPTAYGSECGHGLPDTPSRHRPFGVADE